VANTEDKTMRRIFISASAVGIVLAGIFVLTHGAFTPLRAGQAGQTSSMRPFEMMTSYQGTLPIEQWPGY